MDHQSSFGDAAVLIRQRCARKLPPVGRKEAVEIRFPEDFIAGRLNVKVKIAASGPIGAAIGGVEDERMTVASAEILLKKSSHWVDGSISCHLR